jgi:hypothetical protein
MSPWLISLPDATTPGVPRPPSTHILSSQSPTLSFASILPSILRGGTSEYEASLATFAYPCKFQLNKQQCSQQQHVKPNSMQKFTLCDTQTQSALSGHLCSEVLFQVESTKCK